MADKRTVDDILTEWNNQSIAETTGGRPWASYAAGGGWPPDEELEHELLKAGFAKKLPSEFEYSDKTAPVTIRIFAGNKWEAIITPNGAERFALRINSPSFVPEMMKLHAALVRAVKSGDVQAFDKIKKQLIG